MTGLVAALPMYDWPEVRAAVDAQWAVLRDRLRAAGVPAPERLARRNGDLPPVPGGIRDAGGRIVAPDPGTLPPDEFDLATLWRHPRLLLAQTCWGPMEKMDLSAHVRVVGQPSYDGIEGGEGTLYSSALVMRDEPASPMAATAPSAGMALLPLDALRGARFAFNDPHSRSGLLGLADDLEAAGAGLSLFVGMLETGGHRHSIRAVAEGRADVVAIDCLSWAMARRHEPAARRLRVVGWTRRRLGLPFVSAHSQSGPAGDVRMALAAQGVLSPTAAASA